MTPKLIQRARSGVKRDLWITIGPGWLLIVAGFFIAARFIQPAPHR